MTLPTLIDEHDDKCAGTKVPAHFLRKVVLVLAKFKTGDLFLR
tara:strand:+ start:7184 stop:7312 length:129 start_codon:yes stop_codon:yes gene_type:complete